MVGMTALWLSQPKADFLRGGLGSVKRDVEELEANKERIVKEQLLKIKYVPNLPVSGGKGFTEDGASFEVVKGCGMVLKRRVYRC